jgi:hypothetical protein
MGRMAGGAGGAGMRVGLGFTAVLGLGIGCGFAAMFRVRVRLGFAAMLRMRDGSDRRLSLGIGA